jgi:hypothetical protein
MGTMEMPKRKINHEFPSVDAILTLPAPQFFVAEVRRDQFFISFRSFNDLLCRFFGCLLPLEIKSMLLQFLFITVSRAL